MPSSRTCREEGTLLRAILLYLSKATWARSIVTGWGFARRASARFVAGDHLEAAITAVQALGARGMHATLDHLGEHVTTAAEARGATDDYLVILDRICSAGVRSNASLKLSQLGLEVDDALCRDNLRRIVAKGSDCGVFIRIDMEDSSTVDRTLAIYRNLAAEGLTNVGLVLQAYLYRTEDDLRALLAEGARIRLCKGAYNEPASVAFPKKADVDRNYDRLVAMMLDATRQRGGESLPSDGRTPPPAAIATHDPRRITFARQEAERLGLPRQALEFQMLYGIRSDLQQALTLEAYPVRIYVPYGREWYPYYVRRLAERPANLWWFLTNLVRG
jgi:proline dehydrogenase